MFTVLNKTFNNLVINVLPFKLKIALSNSYL
jgi:hypothetical protein